jgi:hypothetical protein
MRDADNHEEGRRLEQLAANAPVPAPLAGPAPQIAFLISRPWDVPPVTMPERAP